MCVCVFITQMRLLAWKTVATLRQISVPKGKKGAYFYTGGCSRQLVYVSLTSGLCVCVSECVCVLGEVQVAAVALGHLHCHSPHVRLPGAAQHPWASQTAPAGALRGRGKQVAPVGEPPRRTLFLRTSKQQQQQQHRQNIIAGPVKHVRISCYCEQSSHSV